MKIFTRKRVLWACLVLFVIICINAAMSDDPKSSNAGSASKSASTEASYKIGDKQRAGYFDVTVTGCEIVKSWQIDEFQSIGPKSDTRFAMVSATYVNMDSEGRTIFSNGKLVVEDNGQELEYDKTEAVLAPGYNAFFEPLNPRMKYEGIFVFPIPSSLTGKVYYQPESGEKIQLGFLGETGNKK